MALGLKEVGRLLWPRLPELYFALAYFFVVGPWLTGPMSAMPNGLAGLLVSVALLDSLAIVTKVRAVYSRHAGAAPPLAGELGLFLAGLGVCFRTMVMLILLQNGLDVLSSGAFERAGHGAFGALVVALVTRELWLAYRLRRQRGREQKLRRVAWWQETLADAVLAVPAAFVAGWYTSLLRECPEVDLAFPPSAVILVLYLAVYVVLVFPFAWLGAWSRRPGGGLSWRAVALMGAAVIVPELEHMVYNSASEWQSFVRQIEASTGSPHFSFEEPMVLRPKTAAELCAYQQFDQRPLETLRITVGHMEYFHRCLTRFPGLREADFSGNHLRDFTAADAPELRVLNLSHNRIQRFDDFDPLGSLSLETLDLSHGNVQRCSPGSLGEHLQTLDLTGNPLSDCEFDAETYPALKRLILRDVGRGPGFVERVRRDLPHVEVID